MSENLTPPEIAARIEAQVASLVGAAGDLGVSHLAVMCPVDASVRIEARRSTLLAALTPVDGWPGAPGKIVSARKRKRTCAICGL